MGNESSKSHLRRTVNGDYNKYFVGRGIDIGCGNDPVLSDCERWDKDQGDAQLMEGLKPETYDWVYSSHCLEHLLDPHKALNRWWELVKPMGYLIVTVPDYILYEKRTTTGSRFNPDHKYFFTKARLYTLIRSLPYSQLIRLQLNDDNFDYSDFKSDQTQKGAQSEIEVIVRKQISAFWAD